MLPRPRERLRSGVGSEISPTPPSEGPAKARLGLETQRLEPMSTIVHLGHTP